jgi:hypothetical protein
MSHGRHRADPAAREPAALGRGPDRRHRAVRLHGRGRAAGRGREGPPHGHEPRRRAGRVPAGRRRERGVDARHGTAGPRLAAEGADVVLVHPPAYFGPYLSRRGAARPFPRRRRRLAGAGAALPHPEVHEGHARGRVRRRADAAPERGRAEGLVRRHQAVRRLHERVRPGCRLFVGNGALLYTALELGAAGGILAIADFAPALCAELVRQFRRATRSRRAGSRAAHAAAQGDRGRRSARSASRRRSTCSAGRAAPPRAPLRAARREGAAAGGPGDAGGRHPVAGPRGNGRRRRRGRAGPGLRGADAGGTVGQAGESGSGRPASMRARPAGDRDAAADRIGGRGRGRRRDPRTLRGAGLRGATSGRVPFNPWPGRFGITAVGVLYLGRPPAPQRLLYGTTTRSAPSRCCSSCWSLSA